MFFIYDCSCPYKYKSPVLSLQRLPAGFSQTSSIGAQYYSSSPFVGPCIDCHDGIRSGSKTAAESRRDNLRCDAQILVCVLRS